SSWTETAKSQAGKTARRVRELFVSCCATPVSSDRGVAVTARLLDGGPKLGRSESQFSVEHEFHRGTSRQHHVRTTGAQYGGKTCSRSGRRSNSRSHSKMAGCATHDSSNAGTRSRCAANRPRVAALVPFAFDLTFGT